MENFDYYNPVKILFGKGKIAEIGKWIPRGMKIMMTYGGGSIKKNGVYEQVMGALQGFDVLSLIHILAWGSCLFLQRCLAIPQNR